MEQDDKEEELISPKWINSTQYPKWTKNTWEIKRKKKKKRKKNPTKTRSRRIDQSPRWTNSTKKKKKKERKLRRTDQSSK